MKTKLTALQAAKVSEAVRLHRVMAEWCSGPSPYLILSQFELVAAKILKVRQTLHAKGIWDAAAQELATPLDPKGNCIHLPTQSWEEAVDFHANPKV